MVEAMAHKCDKRDGYETRNPIQDMKSISSQMVDPQFTELLFKFNFVVSNTESLLHACEQYKRSLRYFFTESIKMLEIFHQVLDERDMISPSSPINSPHTNPNFPESLIQVPQPSPPLREWGRTSEDDYCSIPNIGRLQRQMIVIVRRAEQDLLFFEKSVQGPLAHLIIISRNVSRTISRRGIANAECGQLATKHHDLLRNSALGKRNVKRQQEEASVIKKLQISLEKFDALNELCKDGLAKFLNLSNQLLDGWFHNYYYTNLRISYALHHFSWNVPEFRKIGIANSSSSGGHTTNVDQLTAVILSTSGICQDFHAAYDVISKQVASLVHGLDK
ncbi:hypothetical protein ZYGR_0H04540 [Zygosaccharomyces rouxii]|uniref:ZYRO0B14454p n=2 Tax=Zygosaccharomyces rouxii TaxID=4956 RepID=C5DS75_ZYGRC|nr:uncharacterized protein ZYRO0B14454g [Zygosaccharomyces rouxii]KAH9199835.1 hypothetical protein LQ764DRAFT_108883 [Zygosaccharomyces rouxii]GAV47608.1 hypothetical protein ZYGR_0H04540 [Zygosaccharomyces rouxii]CAR26636.1 ZYRO0B14454p [Zygosaccharomyces rouxii]